MIKKTFFFAVALACMTGCKAPDNSIRPIPFTDVKLTNGFWKERMQTELDVTVPFSVEHGAPAVERFRRCAEFLAGHETELPQTHRFISSDLYKVMEGVAYSLMLRPNEKLETWMDNTISLIAASQKEDGYLYISHICGNPNPGEMGEKPYSYVIHSHELYNMGHLYEAAVAYFAATGKRQLLDVAEKSAKHINKVFFEGDPNYNDGKPVNQAPGHEEIELALCKMYRCTGEKLYLEMARKFLEIRGVTFVPDGEGVNHPQYAQQHLPVKEQREAVGHCVRAIYLYTGMAQVDAITGNAEYMEALDAIWEDLVSSRIHITGGLGADRRVEGFGEKYSLPNKEAYDETCAACANVFWNNAMFLAEGDAKYWDIAEISLFNNALAGISLSGDRFFYVNPLEADGEYKFNHGHAGRAEWFGCACCPPNISRLILQTPGYMYSHTDKDIYVTLYAGNEVIVPLRKCKVQIAQQTNYPQDGNVSMTLNPSRETAFALRLRIPTWCRTEEFMPGNLYTFCDKAESGYRICVNDTEMEVPIEKGFAVIDRTWKAGDVVKLELKMPSRHVVADKRVKEDAECHAITQGPLVYCEETINEETNAIPYYTWANKGDNSKMRVWIPNSNTTTEEEQEE